MTASIDREPPATTATTATTAPTAPTAMSMRALGAVVALYEKLSGFSGRSRPAVRPVNRDLPVVVRDVHSESPDVVSLTLAPARGGQLPAWSPGAHVDVVLPSGRMRQYSLTGDPNQRDQYRIAVRRMSDGGGGSIEMHALEVGSLLTLRGPRNAFPYVVTDRYLFVAGGIGVTPIRPMLYDAIRRGADWSFVYTGRSRSSMPFLDEFTALDPARVHIWPDDEYGTPDGRRILAQAPDRAALYCCGPPPMIEAIRAQIPADNIATLHYERFSPPAVVGGRPFEVVLARSGHVVTVAADQTALAAIRARLPDVAYSCQQGFCGTCPVGLIGGDAEHRDRCLNDEQRASRFAICVSRGRGRLTLDV